MFGRYTHAQDVVWHYTTISSPNKEKTCTYVVAVLDRLDRDQVVIHAGRIGVDAGKLVAAIVTGGRLIVSERSKLAGTLAALVAKTVIGVDRGRNSVAKERNEGKGSCKSFSAWSFTGCI